MDMHRSIKFSLMGIGLVVIIVLSYWMMAVPKVSVVMSTYNRADLLPRAIESILNQSFRDFEFIIVDDGSSDETAKILKTYAHKDRRIKVLTNEPNQGLVYSLNRGIEAAKGKYIARMDDDDLSLMDRLQKQYYYMENNPDVAVVASWATDIKSNKLLDFPNEFEPERIKVVAYLGITPIVHPTAMIRTDFLQEHQIKYTEEYKYIEDRKIWLDIMDAGGKIAGIPEVLVRFRMHNKNSPAYYREQFISSVRLQRVLFKRFSEDDSFLQLSPEGKIAAMLEINKDKHIFDQKVFEEIARDFLAKVPPNAKEIAEQRLRQ